MSASDDFEPICLGSQFRTQMLFRVNRVHHRAVGDVGAGHKADDFRGRRVAHE